MSRAALVLLSATAACLPAQGKPIEVDRTLHHLGDSKVDSWAPQVTAEPEGHRLDLAFAASGNRKEFVLLVKHRDVDNPWHVELNGRRIAGLERGKVLQEYTYLIPARTLKRGKNRLSFIPTKTSDDIIIGAVRIIPATLREHLRLQPLEVRVVDPAGKPLPARITVCDAAGKEVIECYYASTPSTAVRKGVVYTARGKARFELPPGAYTIHASRGMEWGVGTAKVEVAEGAPAAPVVLEVAREVDTRGYVAADTHIHTLTFSGHGDSNVEERMITLAAEGVELAISTDHNHQTDYRPYQQKLRLNEHFTPVIGNEVTTSNGHFNAFPFPASGKKPNHRLSDWVKLVEEIRSKGAKVIILNHPRWPQIQTGPFGKKHFELNRITGARKRGPAFKFDAMELINATTKANDPIYNFIDWFALLNHGETIKAVGSSDSHTVGDPVGQGRTYLRSSTDDPAAIRVPEACKAFKQGFSSISMGIFAEIRVAGATMGERVSCKGQAEIEVALRIAHASWARADRVRVYLNGAEVYDQPFATPAGKPCDRWLEFKLPAPQNDAHLVAVVTGPRVPGRFWSYNPINPYLLAATNPVWLDADGDGKYLSPRHQAEALLRRHGMEPAPLAQALAERDDAVCVQTLHALEMMARRLAGKPGDRRAQADALVTELGALLRKRPRIREFLAGRK